MSAPPVAFIAVLESNREKTRLFDRNMIFFGYVSSAEHAQSGELHVGGVRDGSESGADPTNEPSTHGYQGVDYGHCP
jgi:hypothetical protein